MIRKLRILIQILLINFLILFFFSFNLAFSNNNICNYFSEESLKLKTQNYPHLIEIETPDTKKWFIRTLKSIGENRINKFYKKYQKAKFKITYPNNLTCEYEGKIRIHGGRVDHIDVDKLNSSMRIILENGHVSSKYNFALLKENTISFENEIFATTLFEKMGFLSGLNYITRVTINGSEVENFLFREIPTLEMAKDSKRNNGIFLQSNKNDFSKFRTIVPYTRSIILNRIKNSDGIAENNYNTILYALDKLNYLYLNSLGIGNGKKCCEDDPEKSNSLLKKHYSSGVYPLNFSIFEDETEIERNSIFNLLMNAINSTHGLSLEDRGFFYDPTFDRFEPFYRDGDANIINQKSFNTEQIQLFEFEKKYINKTISMLNNINLNDFKKKLNLKGLDIGRTSLESVFNKIVSNLNEIRNLDLYENYNNDYTKNYFFNHFDKDLEFNLAFGGLDNQFEICDIKLTDCKIINFDDEQKTILLKDKWINLDQFNKSILYVRLSKNDYINNIKPKKRGLKRFEIFDVSDNFKIYHNSQKEAILVNKVTKEITLNQYEISEKFIFNGTEIEDWNVIFNGSEKNLTNDRPYKRDENMIGGCITFINSKFKNISIKILDNTCAKGIEVLNSDGFFSDIFIKGSRLDAFDAEFSNINIKKIFIQGAIGECIGLKRGKYKILGAILNDCLDHSISVGEHAELIVDKVIANNSGSGKYGNARYHKKFGLKGIMAKDSAKITLHEYKNINSRKCILSIRKKNYYDGAVVKIKKRNFSCDIAEGINKDKYSIVEFF